MIPPNVAAGGAQASVLLCRSHAQINTEGCVRKSIRRKTFAKICMTFIPDRSRPGLTTAAVNI